MMISIGTSITIVYHPSLHPSFRISNIRTAHSLSYAATSSDPTPKGMERLALSLEKQEKKKGTFSRRRAIKDDEDVTYINERNMNFNKKIGRAYDK